MDRGVVYVAYGKPARTQARLAIASLRKHTNLPVAVISDEPMDGVRNIYAPDADPGARWAKLSLDLLTPFKHTLYLDADTRVRQDISAGFDILVDGWDMAIAPSVNQIGTGDWLWHCDAGDRTDVVTKWGFFPLVLQGGVMFLAMSERVHKFFEQWRVHWSAYRNQDQGALLRALYDVPLKVWLLGRVWNGGAAIEHRFGAARRKHV